MGLKLNGTINIPIRYILTILTGLTMVIGSYFALENRINSLDEKKASKENVQKINERLVRIEEKIDLMLGGRISPP